jgi:hypothetical protein
MTPAEQRLGEAVEDYLRECDRGIPVDWALVIQSSHLHSHEEMYSLAFSGGQMATHRVVGLFGMGQHLVLHGERDDE